MVAKSKGILDDELQQLNIQDMSGGLVTAFGPWIGPNQSPDCLNVLAYNGMMLFRGGYSLYSPLPGGADGSYTYVDAGGVQHLMTWVNGSLYDYRTGAAVLVAASVYTPGQQIGHTVLNNKMYWATLTVPLRQYDGTTESAVPNSGGVGVIAPPAANFLLTYNGTIVAVYPVPSGVPEPSAFMWSDVNDPTTWFGTAIQTVGSNDGSTCNFAILTGIIPGSVSNPGTAATSQLMVGKSNGNIFLYQGALGTLLQNAVPSPVGIIDGNSAVYIPTKEGTGAVMFLGSDAQFYLTNGSSCIPASNNIKNLVYALTQNALILNPNQRFYATYNAQLQYYVCDFGNGTQLAYKWDTEAWWQFDGWPSGPFQIAKAPTGLPTIFVCSSSSAAPGAFQIGLAQTNDNGGPINAYYTTPYLHGGKPEREKIFNRLTLIAFNVGIQYTVVATTMPRSDGSQQTSQTLVMNDSAFASQSAPSGTGGIWDQSKWDNATWGGGLPTLAQPYFMCAMRGLLNILSLGTRWIPKGMAFPLRTGAIQIKISWSAGVSDFKIVGLNVAFMYRGTRFVGNKPYSAEGNVNNQNNRFTNVGEQT